MSEPRSTPTSATYEDRHRRVHRGPVRQDARREAGPRAFDGRSPAGPRGQVRPRPSGMRSSPPRIAYPCAFPVSTLARFSAEPRASSYTRLFLRGVLALQLRSCFLTRPRAGSGDSPSASVPARKGCPASVHAVSQGALPFPFPDPDQASRCATWMKRIQVFIFQCKIFLFCNLKLHY